MLLPSLLVLLRRQTVQRPAPPLPRQRRGLSADLLISCNCFLFSQLSRFHEDVGGCFAATCDGCMTLSLGSPSHPPNPAQSFHPPDPPIASQSIPRDVRLPKLTRPAVGEPFHPPTHRLLCNRLPGTRPFPRWRWRDAEIILPSSLVGSSGRGWIDLLLRAWTSTATIKIRLVWCARSASTGDQPARTPLVLRSQPTTRGMRCIHRWSSRDYHHVLFTNS